MTGAWWSQRLTSIALVPLTLFFLFPFARNLGQSFETVRAAYAQPFNAVVAILFLAVGFYHLQHGIQEVMSTGPSGGTGMELPSDAAP